MGDFLWRAEPWARTLVAHNWPIMVLSVLVLWIAIRAYLRPSRRALLLLYGLVALAIAFEYQKHGTVVIGRTADYLFGAESTAGARRIARLLLVDALPPIVYVLGATLVATALAPIPRRRERWTAFYRNDVR